MDDVAIVDNIDAVHAVHGPGAVGDDDGDPVFPVVLELGEDFACAFGVDGA